MNKKYLKLPGFSTNVGGSTTSAAKIIIISFKNHFFK